MSVALINPYNNKFLREISDGLTDEEGNFFPYLNGVYRFAGKENYTDNFGFQWNKFSRIQIDGQTKSTQSEERFFKVTGWTKGDFQAKNILEVGSGAGRFSKVILKHTKANLYSVDYSNAVEANFANNGPNSRLQLFQASIYELPFEKGSFDKVFCFGVLQHTPDFKKSIQCLCDMVKPGGELIIDFYPIKGWYTKIHSKYLLRPFTKNMNHERLLRLIEKNVDWMISVTKFFDRIGFGKIANRFIPVCNISGTLPKTLSKEELREWVILDTFDMFSPAFDNPQKISTVTQWFKEFGMKEVWGGFIDYDKENQVAVVKGIK